MNTPVFDGHMNSRESRDQDKPLPLRRSTPLHWSFLFSGAWPLLVVEQLQISCPKKTTYWSVSGASVMYKKSSMNNRLKLHLCALMSPEHHLF